MDNLFLLSFKVYSAQEGQQNSLRNKNEENESYIIASISME